MTFTILGATGSIGSLLHTHLEEAGTQVFAPARGDDGIFERPLGRVVYCVGMTADFRARPVETVEAHVELLRQVLARASFESLLYMSSTRVYRGLDQGEEDLPLQVRPGDADDLYNASKLLGESLCLASPRGEGRVVRLSNVVGPGARSPSFVSSLVAAALDTGSIRLETHPDSVKDYVDIRDVVELLPQIVDGRERIYNVASGVQTTHRDVAELLATLTGCDVEFHKDAPRASFPPISTGRIAEEFGFAWRSLRTSLEDMVAAERTVAGR
jgi:nucleoside-diphosphate-sugar epimerase